MQHQYKGDDFLNDPNQREYKKAIKEYDKFLDQSQKLKWFGGRKAEAEVLKKMAIAHALLAEYDKSLKKANEVFEILKKGSKREQSSAYSLIGQIYLYKGEYEKAVESLKQALHLIEGYEISILNERKIQAADVIHNLAIAYQAMGNLEKAKKLCERAQMIFESANHALGVAEVKLTLGSYYLNAGKLSDAEKLTRESLNLYSEKKRNTALQKDQLGDIYLERGDYQAALYLKSEALEEVKVLKIVGQQALIYISIGNIYLLLGNKETAQAKYYEALNLYQEADHKPGIAKYFNGIGDIYLKEKKYDKAREQYQQALENFIKARADIGIALTQTKLGCAYEGLKEPEKALQAHKASLKKFKGKNRLGEAEAYNNLGRVYKDTSNFRKALNAYQKSLKIALDPDVKWRTQFGLGQVYAKQGQFDEAIHFFKDSIATVEATRGKLIKEKHKTGFLEDKIILYKHMVELHLKRHKKGEAEYDQGAFNYAERGKARGLLDLLAKANVEVTEGIDPGLLEEKNNLNKQIIALETRQRKELSKPEDKRNSELVKKLEVDITSLKLQENRIQNKIQNNYSRYAKLTQPTSVTIEELRNNVLREDEVLLEYSVIRNQIVIFVVSKENFKVLVHVAISPSELEVQIKKIRTSIIDPGKIFDKKSAYHLYNHLFRPVEEYLNHAKVIYIVPDNALYHLPFEVLVTSNKNANNFEDFLLNRPYNFVYIPSASILRSIRTDTRRMQKRANQSLFLGFGDPVYPKKEKIQNMVENTGFDTLQFERLPYTGDEILAIGALYGLEAASDDINLRWKASETRVKEYVLTKYRNIHFATHGILGDEIEGIWQQPSLVLSPNGEKEDPHCQGKNDGFLQMSEVFNLSMNADLVTLSACRTGLGDLVKGEGIVGLTRAFLYAGTPSVIVSLWNVNDLSTAKFMKLFYRNLMNGMNKAEALVKTKRWMIKRAYHTDEYGNVYRYQHPFYWAPYIMVGDHE